MGSPIIGPVPPFSNVPIAPQNYQPSKFFISAVGLGITTLVTTTSNVNYVVGQLCRLLIPEGFGCTQLNNLTGYVISVPAPNQVVLDIDSRFADQFVSASLNTQPQIVAIGEINSGAINSFGRMSTATGIPGAFINISP